MVIIETPIGAMEAVFEGDALSELRFVSRDRSVERQAPSPVEREKSSPYATTAKQLAEYFAGKRKTFDLVLAPKGTPFQLAVWNELTKIEYGDTISYAELAFRIGRPAAVRAVGAANGANPIPLIIPCHRVIGSNGTLTGYGGGIERKQWLLAHEGRRLF